MLCLASFICFMNFFIAEASTSIGGKRSSSSTINSPRASTSKGSLQTIGPGGPPPVKYQKLCTETNQNLSKSANEVDDLKSKLDQENSTILNQSIEMEKLKPLLDETISSDDEFMDEISNKISSLCKQLSCSETENYDLLKENSKLTTQIKDQTITLDKNQEEIGNLKESLSDKNSKLKLQQQKIETFEKNMNTLKDKFLPNDGIEKTFIKLLDKFEYIIGQYTSQKEEIEHLGTQLTNSISDLEALKKKK